MEVSNSPVHECVLQQRCDSVDVVFAHLSNVLKQEGQGFQHTVLDVKLWDSILIHKCRQHCEG